MWRVVMRVAHKLWWASRRVVSMILIVPLLPAGRPPVLNRLSMVGRCVFSMAVTDKGSIQE
jgi:hypothetical protein